MSELRLMPGDWVYCDGSEAFIRLASGHRLMVQHKFGSFDKFLNTANIEPIPLTADILRDWHTTKTGIGWTNGDVIYFGKNFRFRAFFLGDKCMVWSQFHGIKRDKAKIIANYHQLQHLYEALTGEQLERIDL